MATRPRYRVTEADGRTAFQLHVKSVIVSRTVERRDLYEYLNQTDFQQHISDAFRKAEDEMRSATGLVLEDVRGIRYRAGSIIVLKSYIAHFPSAQHFNVFFYDTDRNIRDIEEIIDTKLRGELSYIDNISIATSAYVTLGVIEAEALPEAAAASYDAAQAAATEADAAATPAAAVPSEQAAVTAEPEKLVSEDLPEQIVRWVNLAIAAILIALTLGAFLWWIVTNSGEPRPTPTRSGSTDVPYQDIEIPAVAKRQTTTGAEQSMSCDMPKLSENELAMREPGASNCIRR